MDIKSIVENLFFQLTPIALLLCIYMIFTNNYHLKIELFAILIIFFGFILFKGQKYKIDVFKINENLIIIFVVLTIVITFFLRYYPYYITQVPLGYDSGLYKYGFDTYISYLPYIPESTLPTWFKEMYPQGLFILADLIYVITGLQSIDILTIFTPLICSLMIIPIFSIAKKIAGNIGGLVSVSFYTLSVTQYILFQYGYIKNILGLFLLLICIILLQKERYGILSLTYMSLSIFHRPQFLLMTLVLICLFIEKRDYRVLLTYLLAGIIMIPFWISRIDIVMEMTSGLLKNAFINIKSSSNLQGGTFISMSKYTLISFPYMICGIMGVMYRAYTKKRDPVFYTTLITTIMIIFKIIFFNRFIATLDILLIILSGTTIMLVLFTDNKDAFCKKIILVLTIFLILTTWNTQTIISQKLSISELEDIKWIANKVPQNAYIFTTTNDAPWLLGWTKHSIVAPGLFHWDKYTEKEWKQYLNAQNPENMFLRYNGSQIYLYNDLTTDNKGNYNNNNQFNLILKNKKSTYIYINEQ